MSTLNETDVGAVVASIKFPPQPEVLQKAHALLQQDDPDAGAVVRLISTDTGLSVAILKTVNSSLYSPAQRIGSINDAVRLLGLRSVIQIVSCAVICARHCTAAPTSGCSATGTPRCALRSPAVISPGR